MKNRSFSNNYLRKNIDKRSGFDAVYINEEICLEKAVK